MKKIIFWVLIGVIPLSVGVWFFTRDTLPRRIRIASAHKGGLYYNLAQELAKEMQKRTRRKVIVVETTGSVENRRLLLEKKVELAIFQSSSASMAKLTPLVPLYKEASVVIVRRNSKVRRFTDLGNRKVILGLPGSGMRESALKLFKHYGIQPMPGPHTSLYFTEMARDPSVEAAVVTTGVVNGDLSKLIREANLRILPVDDARAIALKDLHLSTFTIPAGLFSGRPRLPERDIKTISTTAVLVSRPEAGSALVKAVLGALYKSDVRLKVPILIPAGVARRWDALSPHPAAREYFDPYGGLQVLTTFLDSIATLRELLVACAAAMILLYNRWRRQKEEEQEAEVLRLKDRLDVFLEQTLEIEKSQMHTEDVGKLNDYLDKVTRIKLKALEELAHEELRGDNHFAIFLTQCANLIRKIQSKLHYYRSFER